MTRVVIKNVFLISTEQERTNKIKRIIIDEINRNQR